jgi:Arc/MetJ family transcription regulator
MRTNIEIDDMLLAEAMSASGLDTKKATVEEGLRRMVQSHRRLNDLAVSREGRGVELLP